MNKLNKFKLIFASIFTLLPIPAGLILWQRLPDNMIVHWNASGTEGGVASKVFSVFGLPLILLALFWVCVFFTAKDNQDKDQSSKAFDVVFWIIPAISCVCSGIIYTVSLGREINVSLVIGLLFGVMFIVIGNYMPKFRQNYTMGIKIKWTLESEPNWNATHRIAGKLWCVCGALMLVFAFFDAKISFIALALIIIIAVTVPTVYSFAFYKKQLRDGTFEKSEVNTPLSKKSKKISIIAVCTLIPAIAVLMFTGNIDVEYSDASFTVDSLYCSELSVNYADIDSLELCENLDVGARTYGFASARLFLGTFQNDTFGAYTLFSYTGADTFVCIKSGNNTLVIALSDKQNTTELYQTLKEKTNAGN